jgi:hypothetical protein
LKTQAYQIEFSKNLPHGHFFPGQEESDAGLKPAPHSAEEHGDRGREEVNKGTKK